MGIIYALTCRDTLEFYIGSTINYSKRKRDHTYKTNHCKSKQIIERGNYEFKILEENNITDKNELTKREQYWMDEYPDCINKYRAFGYNQKELDKEYYKLNRDKILKDKKKYYLVNRGEKLNKYHYRNSWGGDPRRHNNLLLIDIGLFH